MIDSNVCVGVRVATAYVRVQVECFLRCGEFGHSVATRLLNMFVGKITCVFDELAESVDDVDNP